MQTNILALPLAHLEIETGNNEDWIDTIAYVTPEDLQVDIRGINFEMEIRRRPEANEVILRATTDNQWLAIGAVPNIGHLIICVPEREMRGQFAGTYVGEIRANDNRFFRRCVTIDLTIVEGIAKTL
jgi:hypothetical protein